MEANELIKRFDEMKAGDSLTRKAFVMLANQSTKLASQFLDCVEGMADFNNYVSEDEAAETVSRLVNADGTTGPKWQPDTLFSKVSELGGDIERPGKFNRWALYTAMNMMHSDHYPFLQKWGEGNPDTVALMCYELAVDKLTDKDRPRWIREYFHL